ncbi:MAG: hypothetical protein H7123_00500, partial [Thermoleophilia bacterium]|nr:hypothetical protein [Thermoleophilia bacterium]
QLIVEPKRATAHRGVINEGLDAADIARECEAAGAAAISIVTESELSAGSTADLAAARAPCSLPLLARDIVVHPLQILDLRACGADAIFLPVEAFLDADDLDPDEELPALVLAAQRMGMEVVLSVHSSEQLEIALEAECDVLNIDNRTSSGKVDVERTLDLLAEVPVGTTVISESVARAEEVARLHRAGVDGLLLDEGHLEHGLTAALHVFADLTLD